MIEIREIIGHKLSTRVKGDEGEKEDDRTEY